VIDSDYRGVLGVILFNHGEPYKINKGDRIAQLILEKIGEGIPVQQVTSMDELGGSERGSNGFGSTG
jgi:dUTP pyrophosphatase